MRDDKTFLAKAILVAGAAILLIVEGLFTLSSVITKLIGLPLNLNLQPVLKLVGSAILIAGLMLVLWLLKYRKPSTMIVSTYFTFVKMFTRSPISGVGDRTEPLILSGPQKYVRHPLYLGALATFLGWALITGSTSYVVGLHSSCSGLGSCRFRLRKGSFVPFSAISMHATPMKFQC